MLVNFDNLSGARVRPTKLAHVVLRTHDKKTMAKFYCDFLGGEVVHQNDVLAFITYDDEHHRVALAEIPDLKTKDRSTCGLEHIAFTFETLEDLFLAYRQRRAQGMLPFWCVNHGMTISLYYADPDGNILETQVDVFEDPAEANAYMMSPAYTTNPIGVDFDPEEFIQRINKGESWESLTSRPDSGPRGFDTIPRVKPQL
ncbi:hypothetical protein LTR10_017720 [Elasticomyces elasticus]|uniref:VOC domain-containing protein n=1 Tax=Exophiala sideris TaxID=1016849 RepID=A0ABR0JBF2_9EURO|nr:hypothetical protein LTR10_017720 [Elasticomyces elasticus]KAK5031031.1 hypothetical protein LTS07_004766 [Exophiala sideris]KAK5038753.1 hypothetical protein LTR13_003784 [Exophiala sideris]KAK5060636.1 hypothetical protein LTR69_005235 [Exophiala sideris]KAK5183549.1 hypothetical protein LTR44_003831 [Eurotiomycetes sp. CCFEE 6388]